MDRAHAILKDVFGYDEFRPHQAEIIEAIASGRDVLAVMPTSAGKSICYQVPALMDPDHVAVVISPLISLMADQVAALTESGVRAAYLNSTLSPAEATSVLRAVEGDLTLLYVAPERLGDPRLRQALRQRGVSVVAVDEAHCISQWGSDFRPEYLRIGEFIRSLGVRMPIAALTATATSEVRDAIAESLGLCDPLRVVASFDRPNLSFEVLRPRSERERTQWVMDYVSGRRDRSGIIYCATRKQVDRLWERLRAAGIRAGRYHGGLDEDLRGREQDDFVHDRTCCVVATNAFGMGIDKSDVTYVIHAATPQSIEAYYQEAGRAGRDGSPAQCILLYRDADLSTSRFLIEHSQEGSEADPGQREVLLQCAWARLAAMEAWATGEGCLRERLLAYFGEPSVVCGEGGQPCGWCAGAEDRVMEDRQLDALKALSCVARLQQRHRLQTKGVVAAILKGSREAKVTRGGFDSLSTHGILSQLPLDAIVRLLERLRDRGFIAQTLSAYPELYLTEKGLSLMRHPEPVMMAREGTGSTGGGRRPSRTLGQGIAPGEESLLERLREVRRALAGDKPAYIVASNATLEALVALRPHTMEELLEVKGIGRTKAERYGEELVRTIRHWELEQGR